jgi:hypothetical protein
LLVGFIENRSKDVLVVPTPDRSDRPVGEGRLHLDAQITVRSPHAKIKNPAGPPFVPPEHFQTKNMSKEIAREALGQGNDNFFPNGILTEIRIVKQPEIKVTENIDHVLVFRHERSQVRRTRLIAPTCKRTAPPARRGALNNKDLWRSLSFKYRRKARPTVIDGTLTAMTE